MSEESIKPPFTTNITFHPEIINSVVEKEKNLKEL